MTLKLAHWQRKISLLNCQEIHQLNCIQKRKTMNILIAIDVAQSNNKDTSVAACELLDVKSLGLMLPLKGSDITLLYVREELPSFEAVLKAQADFPEDLNHVVERRATAVLDTIKDSLTACGANVKVEIAGGFAAQVIEDAAKISKCEFVVITQSKHHDSIFLSRVSHHVARHSPVSTIILRKQEQAPDTVVVGLDGSTNCLQNILKVLAGLALDKTKTALHLTYVVNVSKLIASVTPFAFVSAMQENMMMEGEIYLADAQKQLSELGYKNINLHLKAGRPDSEIISLQEEEDASIIVISAQGGGAIKHFLMGHICERVISQAKVTTIVARA